MHRVMRDSPYQAAALLPDTESLFVQDHMVTDDGPVERLFGDTPLLALHRITASRVTGRSSAALPTSPHRPARGWASGKWKKNLSKSACALPRRPLEPGPALRNA